MAGGPGGLEVETAGDAVDVENFAGEVESGDCFALHRFELDVVEGNATAGDKFVFVEALAIDLIGGVYEFIDQRRVLISGDGGPGGVVRDLRGLAHPLPETFGDTFEKASFTHLPDSVVLAVSCENFGGGLFGFGAGPVDNDCEAVVFFGEFAGAPGGGLQNSRAAESPVGDEERAFRFQVVDFDSGMGNRDTLEIVEADVADLESKEGGDRGGEGVPEIGRGLTGVGTADSAGGDEEFFRLEGFASCGFDLEAFLDDFDFGHSTTGEP